MMTLTAMTMPIRRGPKDTAKKLRKRSHLGFRIAGMFLPGRMAWLSHPWRRMEFGAVGGSCHILTQYLARAVTTVRVK